MNKEKSVFAASIDAAKLGYQTCMDDIDLYCNISKTDDEKILKERNTMMFKFLETMHNVRHFKDVVDKIL